MATITGSENSTGRNQGRLIYPSKYNNEAIDRWPFNKRFLQVKNEAMTWYPAWKELAQFANPTRGFFFDQVPDRGKKIDHSLVIDNHARRCVRTLASGMQSGLTSPARPWFRIEFDDPQLSEFAPVKIWCDSLQKLMLDIYARSNVYAVLYMMYEELATFGTGASMILPDFHTFIRGRSYTCGEYYLGSDPKGRVTAIARELWMTVGQLVEEFGIENCTPGVQNSYDQHNLEQWIRVNHLIETNDDRIPNYKDFMNMKFRSIYWEQGAPWDTYLRLGGYDVFPALTPRWAKTTTADNYGRGPGWDALGDTKQLQFEQRAKLLAIDKVGDPPIQVDGSVQGEVNKLPGGVTRFSAALPNAGAKPLYQVQPDINAYREDILEVKKAISAAFFEDMFLMLLQGENQPKMTAYEVAERQAEKLVLLGPLLESVENELLEPLNEILLHRLIETNTLPPPPPAIRGREIKFKYVSVLAQAQRMVGATGMQQVLAFTGNVAQVKPEVLDLLDGDEMVREYADITAIPAKLINPPDKVTAIRKQRAAQQEQQAKLQAALHGAKAAKDGASAVQSLGETPVSDNSALQSTLAAITGGGVSK